MIKKIYLTMEQLGRDDLKTFQVLYNLNELNYSSKLLAILLGLHSPSNDNTSGVEVVKYLCPWCFSIAIQCVSANDPTYFRHIVLAPYISKLRSYKLVLSFRDKSLIHKLSIQLLRCKIYYFHVVYSTFDPENINFCSFLTHDLVSLI